MAIIHLNKENDIVLASFDKDVKKFNALITEEVKQELSALYERPNLKLILDLTGISYIDSTGFGVFLSLMKKANNNYGSFKICGLSPDVQELFELLQLHQIFDICKSSRECLESFD